MARAAVIALAACVPASAQLGAGTGVGYAHRAGAYRDDTIADVRGSFAVHPDVALDAVIHEDTDRIENAFGIGARYRPLRPPCWAPYLRGELSVVNASHLASNVDVLAGAGHWGHLASHVAWFAEVDAVARIGEPNTIALRLELGIAFETARYWR